MLSEVYPKLIKDHDWFHMFSDSHLVNSNGSKNEDELKAIALHNPELRPLFEEAVIERNKLINPTHTTTFEW